MIGNGDAPPHTADDAPPGHASSPQRRKPLRDLAFSGEILLELLDAPDPERVRAGFVVRGHFGLLAAPAFTGKSSWLYWRALSELSGTLPWPMPGVADPEPGRVLLLSPDEQARQVVKRIAQLSCMHPGGVIRAHAARLESLTVVGLDARLPSGSLAPLKLDAAGFDWIEEELATARDEGLPYTLVAIDAYADVLPDGVSENANEDAARIGGRLEELAVIYDVAIEALHHESRGALAEPGADRDIRFAGRGATALAAKARVVSVLEEVRGMPHLRQLRTRTNLGPSPKPLLLEVCPIDQGAEEQLVYFRPLQAANVDDVFGGDLELSEAEVARRICGLEVDEGERKLSVTGQQRRVARDQIEQWRTAGIVTVDRAGKGKAAAIRRAR